MNWAWAPIVALGGMVLAVVLAVAFAHQEDTRIDGCLEESPATFEAWRLSAQPVYGLPSRYVVAAQGRLWACGMPSDRVRCYELRACVK